MFEYIYAKHRSTYVHLALKYWMTPNHVWKLAHGKLPKNHKEKQVLHDLLDLGIVHRHHHSANPDDYDMSDVKH